MKAVLACALVLVAGACAPDANSPDQTVRIVEVEFAKFGACVFRAMSRVWPSQVDIDDRRSEGVVTVFHDAPLGRLTIRPMEVTAKRISETRTEVRTRVLTNKNQAWAEIQPCAGPAGYGVALAVQ